MGVGGVGGVCVCVCVCVCVWVFWRSEESICMWEGGSGKRSGVGGLRAM